MTDVPVRQPCPDCGKLLELHCTRKASSTCDLFRCSNCGSWGQPGKRWRKRPIPTPDVESPG